MDDLLDELLAEPATAPQSAAHDDLIDDLMGDIAKNTPSSSKSSHVDESLVNDLMIDNGEPESDEVDDEETKRAFSSLTRKERLEWKKTMAADAKKQARLRDPGHYSTAYEDGLGTQSKKRKTAVAGTLSSAQPGGLLINRLRDVEAAAENDEGTSAGTGRQAGRVADRLTREVAEANALAAAALTQTGTSIETEIHRITKAYQEQLLKDLAQRLNPQAPAS